MAKHSLRVGDYARNIESGWLGRIEEISPPREVKVNDTESFTETMARMVGINELCAMVGGLAWEDAIDTDDIQFHSLADLRRPILNH